MKKKLLHLAKEHEKACELEKVQHYHMPEDIQKGQANEKCLEVDEREKAHYEQQKLEEEQMSLAVFRFGARDKNS